MYIAIYVCKQTMYYELTVHLSSAIVQHDTGQLDNYTPLDVWWYVIYTSRSGDGWVASAVGAAGCHLYSEDDVIPVDGIQRSENMETILCNRSNQVACII